MPNPSDPWLKFKEAFLTGEAPLLGPERRESAMPEKELIQKLNRFIGSQHGTQGAELLHATALLWHDHLDASHTLSQGIDTPEGSWLHGIMHRREPDYGNAAYWFRKLGRHDAFPLLAQRVKSMLPSDSILSGRLTNGKDWLPLAFIDECGKAEQGSDKSLQATLRQVQAIEFEVLVQHILRKA